MAAKSYRDISRQGATFPVFLWVKSKPTGCNLQITFGNMFELVLYSLTVSALSLEDATSPQPPLRADLWTGKKEGFL